MSGVLQLLSSWLTTAQEVLAHVPDVATALGAGAWPLAVLVGVLGLTLLLAGVRLGRLLSALGGAAVGLLGGLPLAALAAAHGAPGWLPSWVAAAVLGAASYFAPEVYPVVLGLVPGALVGMRVPVGDKAWLGPVVGGLVLGVLGLLLRRVVLAATAACLGAILLCMATLALARQVPALAPLTQRPMLLAGVAAILAVAGTGFQSGRGSPREKAAPRPKLSPPKVESAKDA